MLYNNILLGNGTNQIGTWVVLKNIMLRKEPLYKNT